MLFVLDFGLDFRFFLVLSLLESLPFFASSQSPLDCDHSNTFPSGATKRLGFVFSEAAEEEEEEDGAEGDEEDKDETEDEAGLNTASSELYAARCYSRCPHRPASSASDPSAAAVRSQAAPTSSRQSPHGSSSTGAEQSPRPPSTRQ